MAFKNFQADMQSEWTRDPTFNEFQQILPGLFIGNQISAMETPKLQAAGICQILKVNGIPSLFPYGRL
jgi:hypothetical protein